MKRYKMENGVFTAPPQGCVCADGRVVSNFAGRVQHDVAFAAANGYFPIREAEEAKGELLEESTLRMRTYTLKNGEWVLE